MSYTRTVSVDLPPRQSAFLWGARQTGKSTLLRTRFPDSVTERGVSVEMHGWPEEACSQPFSFFMVRDAKPGARMTIRDLLLKREFDVHERRASRILEKGSIIYTSVVTLDGDSIMLGCAPYSFAPSYSGLFLDLREEMADDEAWGPELLRRRDIELRGVYFDIREDLLDPRLPVMQNTDGDPLQLTKLYYELNCTPQEARDAFAPLALGLGDHGTPKTDKDGQLVSTAFPWAKADNASHAQWF